jgi:signal peptidase I
VRTTPWVSDQTGWEIGGRTYEYTGSTPTALEWDSGHLRFSEAAIGLQDQWEIDDRYAYDEVPMPNLPDGYPLPRYPVSDIRMGAGIEPTGGGLTVRATIAARGHEFQMELTQNEVVLRMRPETPEGGGPGAWKEIGRAAVGALRPDRVTNIYFCHVDQAVEAWIDGKRVCHATYEWSPAERVGFATGKSVEQLLSEEQASSRMSIFGKTEIYRKPRIWWEFEGGPVRMHRVRVDRDIYYQMSNQHPQSQQTARGSRPEAPMVLNEDQFFVCGDNSPQSQDARYWDPPEPFVREIDPTEGIVPRKMMLGKAFFVYFPALHEEALLPVPDFGRMRFIW